MTVDGQTQLQNYPGCGEDALSMADFSKSPVPAAARLLPCNRQQRDAKRVLVAAGQCLSASVLRGTRWFSGKETT